MEAQMLAGKVAIVTGASYGMGGTIAELFAGASVALTARGREKLDEVVAAIRARGFKAVGIVADIKSAEDTKRVFERTICGGAHTASKGALNTLTKNVAMRLCNTNIRCNAIAPGATLTPVHYANLEGKQLSSDKMLEFGNKYCNWGLPETESIDQAYACLYLASKMGRCVKGQLLQVYNGAFL